MRFKCIKLAGFKSFVDPTTVSFPSNLCAIVGPNGCGKSNVIDAVRWVMGESSAKNLRGEAMVDVIFNGSTARKPVGKCSVELVFDNIDGRISGEYAGYNEISIKRQVTRDGQSIYFLNASKCRRRDITDIFLGTGLGPRSYAIIEQGMISRLIESKPEELRVFIEEAAGISKYKERRRETENRMRHTRENLERLTDIREELERQLQHLQRQAQAAEKYTEFKKEERLYKAQLQALRWQVLNEDVGNQENNISELEIALETMITEQRSVDTGIEKQRELHTESSDVFHEVQSRFYSLGADITRIEQGIQHQQERKRQFEEDLRQSQHGFDESKQQHQIDESKLTTLKEEMGTISPELEMARAREEESTEKLLGAEEAMQQWQQEWDAFNQRAAEPRQKAEVEQSRIQHLEQVLSRGQDRIRNLQTEKAHLTARPIEQEITVLTEQSVAMDLQVEQQQAGIAELAEKIVNGREVGKEIDLTLNKQREALQRLTGRQSSLEALQQAALGENNAVVSDWLEQHQLIGRARLADELQVEAGWEIAVETVMGRFLQAVCVDDLSDVAAALNGFEKGDLTLLDQHSAAVLAESGKFDQLAHKVQSKPDVSGLLAGVYVADNLAEALARRAELNDTESVISKEGIWLGANWLRVARDSDEQSGILQRKQELEQLEVQLSGLQNALEQANEQQEDNLLQLKQWELHREQMQKEQSTITREHGELRSELSAKQVHVEQIQVRRQRADKEIEEAHQQFEIEQQNLSESRITLQTAMEAMARDTDHREELLQQRDNNRSILDRSRQEARHNKDIVHQLALREQTIRAQLESTKEALGRVKVQLQRLDERCNSLRESIAESDMPIEEMRIELESLLEKRLIVEDQMTSAKTRMDSIEHELHQLEKARNDIEGRAQKLRDELVNKRLSCQSSLVRRNSLQEQLQENQLDLETVIAALPAEANEQEWTEYLEKLANRIQRLGAINLAAIDEYKTQSERKNLLDVQNDDLQEALLTLENAIKKIDRETRTRFKETFDKINSGLQELFPKVFGGGHAYLEMTGDDLLDTGIAIMARPPGKRNSTIHLLSGGEKAMTAISLVFSIFRLNPAPFCMLDEVDAPLDDLNVGRYARLVHEMAEKVQFICITHNKIAMESAYQLLGVTMHEPGVSRIVTVDVDEAAELAAS